MAGADAVGRTWEAALTAGAVILASEQLGVANWCLESTVDYVKTRYQFARPVGSFQAVKHRLAQLWVEVTQARAVARYAAGCLADGDPDVTVAASLAQAHCGPVAVRAAEECRAAARRDRLHLGASDPLVPEAGQEFVHRAGYRGPAPRGARHPGRSAADLRPPGHPAVRSVEVPGTAHLGSGMPVRPPARFR